MEILISLKNKGQIVYAQSDFSNWGKEECLDKFLVVRIETDKTLSELRNCIFDLDSAFTEQEWADVRNSDWKVLLKGSEHIKEKI